MSETYVLFGWSTLLTIIGILFMFILKGLKDDISGLWKSHDEIKKKCEEIVQHTNNMYVRRDDYLRFQDQIMDSVQRIEDKIDNFVQNHGKKSG